MHKHDPKYINLTQNDAQFRVCLYHYFVGIDLIDGEKRIGANVSADEIDQVVAALIEARDALRAPTASAEAQDALLAAGLAVGDKVKTAPGYSGPCKGQTGTILPDPPKAHSFQPERFYVNVQFPKRACLMYLEHLEKHVPDALEAAGLAIGDVVEHTNGSVGVVVGLTTAPSGGDIRVEWKVSKYHTDRTLNTLARNVKRVEGVVAA